MQKGTISVQTDNIFPIIKQFLYSDQEIFLRELVSNATDATTKLKTLSSRGIAQGELGDLTIEIILDEAAKTLTIRDKGIGMTEEEVNKYLNQVAFSSAAEFLEKYKDESIIGHFGLGFYSAFMVAEKVEVVTKSFQKDAHAVCWTCDGTPNYTIETVEKAERGTDIILHVGSKDEEFLEQSRIEGLLNKYCKFLPVPIQFGTRKEHENAGEESENDDAPKGTEVDVPNIINATAPIWKKSPTELTDEQYKAFYNELYPMSSEPLFWIHLNIDYPFNLTGVLYFPKLTNNLEVQKNKIQLYCNQVYVTDDVKDIVPEFLTLLHGVIDSPDIPLNVSRSALQSNREVKQITNHISKKVTDKLQELFNKDRADFEQKWKDISVFVKYGMLSDDKFYERALKFALLQNTNDQYFTVADYKEKVKSTQTDKHNKLIFPYSSNKLEQDTYIQAAKSRGYEVLLFDTVIDNHFMQMLESKVGDVTFVRVDSDTVDNLIQKDEKTESVLTENEQNSIKGIFEGFLPKSEATLVMKAMSPEDKPVMITKPEFMRRMKEMQALQGSNNMFGSMGDFYNVVVNTNHPIVASKLLSAKTDDEKTEMAQYLYNLALLNQNMLKGAQLSAFVEKALKYMN
jgi:molecular chaperone HtpG